MKTNENEILTIAGKKVAVRYTREGHPCDKCVLDWTKECDPAKCSQLNERAYFVEAPEPAVNKHAVKHAFLHCAQAGKIVSEMYGDKFNNPCNRDKYIAFLGQVNLDDRFGELAGILQKYGAMPAPKEQPEADLEAEISRVEDELHGFEGSSRADCINIARHFAEWERERIAARMRAALEKMNPGDVVACVFGWIKNSKK